MRHPYLPFSGAYRCEPAALRSCRRLAPSHRVLLSISPRVARVARSVWCTGRVARPGVRTHPCESLPRAGSRAARHAVQRPRLSPQPRPSLPWLQGKPSRSSHRGQSAAAARARAITLDLLDARDMARAVLGVWGAAGAFSARAGTARALGRWVEGTRAVHHRLGMVSALACPLGRAPELPVYGMQKAVFLGEVEFY